MAMDNRYLASIQEVKDGLVRFARTFPTILSVGVNNLTRDVLEFNAPGSIRAYIRYERHEIAEVLNGNIDGLVHEPSVDLLAPYVN